MNTIYFGKNTEFVNRLNRESQLMQAQQTNLLFAALKQKTHAHYLLIELGNHPQEDMWLLDFINEHLQGAPMVLLGIGETDRPQDYLKMGLMDVYPPSVDCAQLDARASFLFKHTSGVTGLSADPDPVFSLPWWKRAVDILLSAAGLLLLAPLFMLIALLIRLESKGKVFYASKRIGSGFKVFNFYKFRSMHTGADTKVDALMAQNQYAGEAAPSPAQQYDADGSLLFYDDGSVGEASYLANEGQRQERSFLKVKNDPRITRVGRFIRNTSIDELPQLFNVLKGDMSIVGNRPLPVYEAEMLTSDAWAKRFLAPAGLTGLWQITKRGNSGSLSPTERKQLDIDYADNYSFFGDLKIIFKTLPAMLQHENV